MVDAGTHKILRSMWIGHFVLLFFLCVIEVSKVEHSASYVVGCWWLLPRCIRSRGHPFRIAAVNKKIPTRSKYACETNAIRNVPWIRFETFRG